MGYQLIPRFQRKITPVEGLLEAKFCPAPAWASGARAKGKFARGRAYERKVLRELERASQDGSLQGKLWVSPWIRFSDNHRPRWTGLAQPDFLVERPEGVIIGEIKLKQDDLAREQIYKLYAPLVEFILDLPVVGLEVFKYSRKRRNAAWLDGLEGLNSIDFPPKVSLYYLHKLV